MTAEGHEYLFLINLAIFQGNHIEQSLLCSGRIAFIRSSFRIQIVFARLINVAELCLEFR